MQLTASPISPVMSEYAFLPSSDMDCVSLFEQCGIPLADLSTHLSAELTSTTMDATKQWYHGTAPADDDPLTLDNDRIVGSASETKSAACQSSGSSPNVLQAKKSKIDGSGNSPVSDPQEAQADFKASAVSSPAHHEAVEHARRLPVQSSGLHRHNQCDASARPATPALKTLSPARRATRALQSSLSPSSRTSKKTLNSACSQTTTKVSPGDDMDFYAQRQYYAGAQLSSPISMQSCPEDDDAFLYSATFSPEFDTFQNSGLTGAFMDSESMRRSMSTPFLGQRSLGGMQTLSAAQQFDISPPQDTTFSMEEIVPASNNARWNTGEYLMPQNTQVDMMRARSSISAARPTMKRKNRPMPIATNAPRSSGLGIPHTAPMDGRFMTSSMERPMLSAKRSFEDFAELGSPIDVPPYRHISTPISKRARSSQGFGSSIPASPFTDSPLFSPVYNNGFARSMDPEQLLLSSPPYSQSDFCSSPGFMIQPQQDDMTQMFTPNSMPSHDYTYGKHEPLSAVDFEGMWPQKYAFERPPQISARPVIATPRSLTYGATVPMRKTMTKPRRASTVKAISFCNYTAADKKTILSGVAPSGSNKKAITKAQEMNRSQSSSAIAV